MSSLREFANSNDIRIGEGKDIEISPPVYYTSLFEAFHKYFLTFRDKKDGYHFLVDIHSWTREGLAFNFVGDESNTVFTILNFHRFFELLIKDILRRINPYLAVKLFEKNEEVFRFLDSDLSADEIKTIEYGETIKRFIQAYKYYDKESDIYLKYLAPYSFLIEPVALESLEELANWRNSIMHNGNRLPNLVLFEYLISQRIIPIIEKILIAESGLFKEYNFSYLKTQTGIDLLKEILSVKFNYKDFEKKANGREIGISILKLGHIKEFGRATINVLPNHNNILYYEPYYEGPIQRNERSAFAEKEFSKDCIAIKKCICCGANSLAIYRQDVNDILKLGINYISWCKCFNCDYSIKNNVADPLYFKLAKEPIFPTE